MISGEELSQLKEEVLKSLLNNQSLPGSNKGMVFPDLPVLLNQPGIYLVDDDVKNILKIEKANKSVQIVSEDFLIQKAAALTKVIYLQFQTKELGQGALLLTLDAKIRSSSDKRTYNLTSMQMRFQKIGNEWKMIDEPTSLSA